MDPDLIFQWLSTAALIPLLLFCKWTRESETAHLIRADKAESNATFWQTRATAYAAALEDLRASLSRSEGDPYRSGPLDHSSVTAGKLTALEALAAYQRWVAVNRAMGVNCCMERGTAHDLFSRIARLPSGLDSAMVGGDE